MLHSRHIEMKIHVTALSVLFLLIDVALHVFIQFATIALTKPFARDVFFNVDSKRKLSQRFFLSR